MSSSSMALVELEDTSSGALSYSVRLAMRLTKDRIDAADRRAFRRRAPDELPGLRASRLKQGPTVSLIDLSEGGVLLDVAARLAPRSAQELELHSADGHIIVPFSVLRSHVLELRTSGAVYRAACAFGHPLDIARLFSDPAPVNDHTRDESVLVAAALQRLLDEMQKPVPRTPGQTSLALETLQLRLQRLLLNPYAHAAAGLLEVAVDALRRGENAAESARRLDDRLARCVSAQKRSPETARLEKTAELLAAVLRNAAVSAGSGPARAADTTAASSWQKIVVRYGDGTLLKGFTQDFHAGRPQFSLWPSIVARADQRVLVPMARLKAVFFVRDFAGNPGYVEQRSFAAPQPGRRVEVTFGDGEVVVGTTLGYRPDGQGFFLTPADPGGNNSRIFVVLSAVRQVRFPAA